MDAPIITQTVPTTGDPVPVGTAVAMLASPGATSYAIATDPGGMFAVVDDTLTLTQEGDGAFFVGVTATDGVDTSPEGSATLTFADDQNEWNDSDDPYGNNPQFPPQLPEGSTDTWQMFLVAATHAVVPHARNGVDFVVARTEKSAPLENVYWDDVTLGARPTAEIEAEAQRLAAEWPSDVNPI